MNYYNDNDKFSVKWLKSLIENKLIPAGDVDDRSITDVKGSELKGYTQCHFFAGIGGWSYALQLAGWPATQPVWTGSCPCQPFSVAGAQGGHKDERHLWPEFARLICECEPPTVFGEQVASKLGREWLSGVRLDLEEMGYVVGAADLCATSIGAPQIRQRLWWVADKQGKRFREKREYIDRQEEWAPISGTDYSKTIWWPCSDEKCRRVPARRAGDSDSKQIDTTKPGQQMSGERLFYGGLGNAKGNDKRRDTMPGCDGKWQSCGGSGGDFNGIQTIQEMEQAYIEIEPSLFPLATGIPGRVGLLRGSGNSIHPHVAAEFIRAFIEETIKNNQRNK